MIDKVYVAVSAYHILRLKKIEEMMMKNGMAEQDISYIITRLCDFYEEQHKVRK
jgi:hypothetical protein